MRNVTLRTTTRGTAVVLEKVILIDKKVFPSFEEASAYVATLNLNDEFQSDGQKAQERIPQNTEVKSS